MGIIGSLAGHYISGTIRKLKKMTGKFGPDPYMKYKEIDLFTELLQNLRPKKVLEYGCGFSTLYYPALLPEGAEWISVEHNVEWYEQIASEIEDNSDKVRVFNKKPDITTYPDDGYYKDFKSYIHFPEQFGPFDLILVDGMARESCIEEGMKMLTPDGILVIHDCNRKKYQPYLKKFPKWIIMEDFRKTAGGFGFGSTERSLHELVDFEEHSKLWNIDSGINNFFKFKFLLGKKSKPFQFSSSSL